MCCSSIMQMIGQRDVDHVHRRIVEQTLVSLQRPVGSVLPRKRRGLVGRPRGDRREHGVVGGVDALGEDVCDLPETDDSPTNRLLDLGHGDCLASVATVTVASGPALAGLRLPSIAAPSLIDLPWIFRPQTPNARFHAAV